MQSVCSLRVLTYMIRMCILSTYTGEWWVSVFIINNYFKFEGKHNHTDCCKHTS